MAPAAPPAASAPHMFAAGLSGCSAAGAAPGCPQLQGQAGPANVAHQQTGPQAQLPLGPQQQARPHHRAPLPLQNTPAAAPACIPAASAAQLTAATRGPVLSSQSRVGQQQQHPGVWPASSPARSTPVSSCCPGAPPIQPGLKTWRRTAAQPAWTVGTTASAQRNLRRP